MLRLFVLRFAALALLVSNLPEPAWAADPPQPTAAAATHRSGQTFVTWTERSDEVGETYRIYRHDQPIDAISLAQATLLAEVGEDSNAFHADRYQPNQGGVWQPRYFTRYVIQDGGAQLPVGTGLLVWTLDPVDFSGAQSGSGYYAITTVDSFGVENATDFGVDNVIGPIGESVDEPMPVEAFASGNGLYYLFIQYLDLRRFNATFAAPNPYNGYYGLQPTDPGVADSLQYAFAYSVALPDPATCPGGVPFELPVTLVLHGWSDNSQPTNVAPSTYCALEIRPVDVGDSWWFGFSQGHDYRTGAPVPTGEVIENYTEARTLRMVYDLTRHGTLGGRVDQDRVYLIGHSMGGAGALALSLRYPEIFAAAYCSEPVSNFRTSGDGGGTDWRPDVAIKWGAVNFNLPVAIDGPSDWTEDLAASANGTGVWDWQNHQDSLELRAADEVVPFGIAYGRTDTITEWSTQGLPTANSLNLGQHCWGMAISDDGHVFQNFNGLAPTLGVRIDGPFYGLRVRLDETVPGFANASDSLPIPPPTTGGYHQTLDWSSSWKPWNGPPLDVDSAWGMSFRSQSGAAQTVDITVRRPQRFQIGPPNSEYVWENRRVSDGTIISAGVVTIDASGLLTVPSFFVSPAGNHLRIRPRLTLGLAR